MNFIFINSLKLKNDFCLAKKNSLFSYRNVRNTGSWFYDITFIKLAKLVYKPLH